MLPVYENLFTNPRLVGDGTYAVVRRNLYSTGALVQLGLVGSESTTSVIAAGSATVKSFVVAVTPGAVLSICRQSPLSSRFRGAWTTAYPTVGMSATHAFGGDSLAGVDGLVVPAGITHLTVYLTNAGEAPLLLIELAPVAGAYFDGTTKDLTMPQPEDFRVRWLGAVNASESVMEIERVRGLTVNGLIAGVSTRDGKPAARLIPTLSGVRDSFMQFPIPASARSGGTILGTVHLDAPLSTEYPADTRPRSIGAYTPNTRVSAPNQAGTFPLRHQYGALTGDYLARWYNGEAFGSGDVWWTDIGLFAGDYAGEAFSGDSGVVVIDGQLYDTLWTGVPDSSSSLVILSEVYSSPIYDTLYVLSTVSNSWSRWQTPAAKGQRPVTLARVTSSPPAEAYTMRVSRRVFDEVRDLYTTPY